MNLNNEIPAFNEVVRPYRGDRIPRIEINPEQWREIWLHHLRVETVLDQLINSPATELISSPSANTKAETKLAARFHDLGKITIPFDIHQATKTPRLAAYYDSIYRFHPLRSLALLGKSFIQDHLLAAQLIFFHHPDQPITRPFLTINPQWPDSLEFKWGLSLLIAADGITSGWEPRTGYNWPTPAPTDFTINFLKQKLTQFGLDQIIVVNRAVYVGYQILNQLNI
jgi:hypothetical protein